MNAFLLEAQHCEHPTITANHTTNSNKNFVNDIGFIFKYKPIKFNQKLNS